VNPKYHRRGEGAGPTHKVAGTPRAQNRVRKGKKRGIAWTKMAGVGGTAGGKFGPLIAGYPRKKGNG